MIDALQNKKYLSVSFLETTREGQNLIALFYYDEETNKCHLLEYGNSVFLEDVKEIFKQGYILNNKVFSRDHGEDFLNHLCFYFTGSYLRCTKPVERTFFEMENLSTEVITE